MERLVRFGTGLILAGGASSRMGQDKALLNLDGTPLLRRVYDRAAQVCSQVYVMTSRIEQYRSILPSRSQFLREAFESSPQGPLRAFQQALTRLVQGEKIQAGWLLLLSCDLPFLQSSVLEQWVTQLSLDNKLDINSNRDIKKPENDRFLPDKAPTQRLDQPLKQALRNRHPSIWVPQNTQGWWEPLCGFYHQTCLPSLTQFIDQGGRSFQTWLNREFQENRVGVLSIPDPEMLFNLNTPTQLDRYYTIVNLRYQS